jgi:RNA polymerase sigma-70 factor (ECF subfamily)
MNACTVPAAVPLPIAANDDPMALLAREEGALRRTIRFYVRDQAAIDDLWQEISLRVLRRIGSLRHHQAVRSWLYQITRHACLDYLRRCDRSHVRTVGVLPEPASPQGERQPIDRLLSSERITAVRRALAELPPSQREAIRLRIEEGLDHEQIATRLGINRQAVEVRLCKGRTTLRERLAEILEGDL